MRTLQPQLLGFRVCVCLFRVKVAVLSTNKPLSLSAVPNTKLFAWWGVGPVRNPLLSTGWRPVFPGSGSSRLGIESKTPGCLFITAAPIIKLCAGGEGDITVKDMCYEIRRAEACVD